MYVTDYRNIRSKVAKITEKMCIALKRIALKQFMPFFVRLLVFEIWSMLMYLMTYYIKIDHIQNQS